MKIDFEHVWFNNYASRRLHISFHNHYHIPYIVLGTVYSTSSQFIQVWKMARAPLDLAI